MPELKINQPLGAEAPVRSVPNEPPQALEDKIALCLSGGGYRAMLFHLGALWRLNEFGYLGNIDRFSSVSGGSITAGVLALNWGRLDIAPGAPSHSFHIVVDAVRGMASHTVDVGSIFAGALGPGTIPGKIQAAYDKLLFRGATLQDLPDSPRFVFNATSVQSGVLWRFSKPYMADWRVGKVLNPRVPLAAAIAASSAFPPVLSPAKLDMRKYGCVFEPGSGADLQTEPYISEAVLTDGGVYDNLGLETAWKRYRTILVSDGGGQMKPEPEPHEDWGRHAFRVLDLIDNQVRSLRKRQVIGAFEAGTRSGAYWGIRTDIARYGLTDALPCPYPQTLAIAEVATRLKALPDEDQERLINWGYAAADAAMRRHVDPELAPPRGFPYPRGVA